jgi:hypothetical protein
MKMLREFHKCHVNGRHLGSKHRLKLVIRLGVFDHGKHEIEFAFIWRAIRIGYLPDKAFDKIVVGCPERFPQERGRDCLVRMIQ